MEREAGMGLDTGNVDAASIGITAFASHDMQFTSLIGIKHLKIKLEKSSYSSETLIFGLKYDPSG